MDHRYIVSGIHRHRILACSAKSAGIQGLGGDGIHVNAACHPDDRDYRNVSAVQYLTVTLLKLSRNNKNRFWNGMNMIGVSQLLYRIKGNARTLTIIAVLSATTLTAVGTAYSFHYSNASAPASEPEQHDVDLP